MIESTLLVQLIVLAYLLGSISTAVWVGKFFFNIDVREHGSKNAGATNTMRVLGKPAGLSVFAIDMMKGFFAGMLPVFFTDLNSASVEMSNMQILLGIVAVIGHIFPIFTGFKGGKGIATLFGLAVAINPLSALCCILIFLTILISTKYVSLGSILTGISYPIVMYFIFNANNSILIFGICVSILIVITHRANIGRLFSGNESKTYLFGEAPKK